MQSYELTFIINPDLNSEQASSTVKEIESLIQQKQGVVLSSQKPIAQTLSYPIKKKSTGYFVTLTFQAEQENIMELKDFMEKQENILRHIILVRKPTKALKPKRAKQPVFAAVEQPAESVYKIGVKENEEKLDQAQLDKKLEELLNE